MERSVRSELKGAGLETGDELPGCGAKPCVHSRNIEQNGKDATEMI